MTRRNKLRIPAVFLCVIWMMSAIGAPVASAYDLPAETTISSPSALLVSLGPTGKDDNVLFEKDADSERPPAALVRLMVGLTAIKIIQDRNIDIDSMTGTYTLECNNEITGTGLILANMKIGDEWTVRDLLSVSMIHTAADACVTLAVTLDGSQEQYVADMNSLAQEIGCTNTSFSNVTGNDVITQYTSARDIYKIIRYGMEYSKFESLFSTTTYKVSPVIGQVCTYKNACVMLRTDSTYYYSPMVMGKTGVTDAAGNCLASIARDSGYEYLCVVMGGPGTDASGHINTHYLDTKTLYKWAFNNFTYETLLDKNRPVAQLPVKLAWNKDSVTLIPEDTFAATVTNNLDPSTVRIEVKLNSESVDAPVTKGQVYGKAELYINMDQKIGEVNLVASESIDRSELLAVWDQVQKFLSSPWFYAGMVLLVLLVIGYVILNIVHNQKRRKNRMKRVKRF